MKKLLMLLLLACAALQAQDCSWAGIPCTGHQEGCDGCHYEIQLCNGEGPSPYCYDCYTPCLATAGYSQITHAKRKQFAPAGHTPLTDLGAAFLAAVVPDFLRNPLAKGRLPKGHPDITSDTGEKLLARMAARNRVVKVAACKAPATVQLLAASMLRK